MSYDTSYPTPSPTEAHKRMHLRKSSRKVEAMLGVTPIVLQVNIAAANKTSVPRPLTTPRTRARRRRAQVCQPVVSPSSSVTDDDDATIVNVAFESSVTLSDASSFIWVKEDSETTPHSGYVPHSIPEAIRPIKPAHRGRSKSEAGSKAHKTKASLIPPLPTSVRLQPVFVKKGQEPERPVLVVQTGLNPGTPPCHRKTPSEVTLTSNASEHLVEPLSPLSPLSPGSSASFAQAQEHEMRRKKMAKLTRTLGGNVPAELVFQGQKKLKERRVSTSNPRRKVSSANLRDTPRTSTESTGSNELAVPKRFQRANRPRSLTVAHPSHNVHNVEIEQVVDLNASASMALPTKAPSIIVEAASPLPIAPSPAKRTDSKRKPLETPKYASAKFTGHVASQSARLAPSAPIPGRCSLDVVKKPTFVPHHAPSKSLADYRTPADYVYGSSVPTIEKQTRVEELHRRKEREWSGEWNVADMGDVMKKLRNLKGR